MKPVWLFDMQGFAKKILGHPLYLKHREKIKFALVGGFNFLLDLVIYGLLANVLGVQIVVANVISTSICIAMSFILNYRFVWKSKKGAKKTAPRFVAVSLFSAWVVQSLTISVVAGIFGEGDVINLVAKMLGVGLGMITNYFGYKLIFR